MIRLHLLGPTDLRGPDGSTILSILSQPKRLSLLAYLAVNATGGFVRRDKILGLFWPDSDTERARASLRKSLSFLRQSLGEGVIVTRGDQEVGVAEGTLECDVVQFDAALDASDLEAAWAHYGGAFLDGLFVSGAAPVEDWIENERSRLRRRAFKTAAALADQTSESDPEAALQWAQEAWALEPLSETAAVRVVHLLDQTGDREAALRAFDEFEIRLSRDLELEPSTETLSLVHSIRTGPELDRGGTQAGGLDDAGSPAPERRLAPAARRAPERRAYPRYLRVITTALAAFIIGLALWGSLRPAPTNSVVRYRLSMAQDEGMPALAGRRIALSPDGITLVYVGASERQLRVRRRDQLLAPALPGTEGALTPFFSPDGTRVGFFSEGQLKISPIEGGPITVVTAGLDPMDGVTWSSDGYLYARPRGFSPLVRLTPSPGAVPEPFTVLEAETGETDHQWPDALPDGRGILFSVLRAGIDGTEYLIAVAEAETGTHKILTEGIFARYAASGHVLFVAPDSTLMVALFDLETLELTGPATVVSQAQRVGWRRSVDVAVSRTGTLVYATGQGWGTRELVWVGRDGSSEPFDSTWHQPLAYPALSPDGSHLAVVLGDQETAAVWIRELASGATYMLSVDGDASGYPSWSPDGQSVTYFSNTSGQVELWTRPVGGGAHATLQLTRPLDLAESVWSSDGEWLIYRTSNVPRFSASRPGTRSPGASDILAVRTGTNEEPVSIAATEFTEVGPALSPDGRWLAYSSNQTGKEEVFVVPFPNSGDAKWAISPDGGTEPVWSHTTGELFYRDLQRQLWAVQVETTPTFSIGPARILFDSDPYVLSGLHPSYAVSPDDQRFLMVREVGARDPGELIVVQNWFSELREQ